MHPALRVRRLAPHAVPAGLLALGLVLQGCGERQESPLGPDHGTPTGPLIGERERGTEGFPSPGELRTGYIFGRDGKPLRITFELQGEQAILEGDIVLGPANKIATSPGQLRAAPPRAPGGPSFGAVRIGSSYRWQDGVMPYEIDPALQNQARVTDAIAHIEVNTPGVDLVPRSGQANYVRFIPATGCWSHIGMVGGVQEIGLADGCSRGNAVHEIGHALGLFHEQSRCDRNSYVEILWANIQPGYEGNFDSRCDDRSDLYEYAEGSIMHYIAYAFSANGQPTIRSLRGLDHLMGQRHGLSTTDIATISQLYPLRGGSWAARAALPSARRGPALAAVSGLLYSIGGRNSSDLALKGVLAYNSSTNSWSTRISLPVPREGGNGAAAIGSTIYLAGGYDAARTLTRTLYAYNVTANTWSRRADLPVVSACGGSAVISRKLYVFSGCRLSSTGAQIAAGSLHRYDPSTNRWTTLRSAPAVHVQPAVGVIGGKLYIVGGNNAASAAVRRLDVYDPATNTWSTMTNMPTARVAAAAAVVGNKLHVIGGRNGETYLKAVEAYDPVANSWTVRAAMPTARSGLGVGVISNLVYAVGGRRSSTSVVATNERYTP